MSLHSEAGEKLETSLRLFAVPYFSYHQHCRAQALSITGGHLGFKHTKEGGVCVRVSVVVCMDGGCGEAV